MLSETTSEFDYDAGGVRVSQTVDGVRTEYLVDSNNPTGYSQTLEEHQDLNGDQTIEPHEVTKSYTLGHDVVGQSVFEGDTLGRQFLMYDGHGSTRALLDAAGVVLFNSQFVKQLFAYDAYGNLLALSGQAASVDQALTSLLYSGEQTDKTGMQYLRARYYDPAVGRFSRLDPFAGNFEDPLSLHKYLYVHGDPANGIDPSGLIFTSIPTILRGYGIRWG